MSAEPIFSLGVTELFIRYKWFLLLFFLSVSSQASPTLTQALKQKIKHAAARVALDPKLIEAIVWAESNFNKKAVSPKGAMGLMQVMPKTADQCEVLNPYHSTANLVGACECLRLLLNRFRGNLTLALAAYNAGVGNVKRYGGVPPFAETRDYVSRILSRYER